jgi:amidase
VDGLLEEVEALVLTTLPTAPPALGDMGDAARMLRLTSLVRPFNVSGHPAISLPIDGPGGKPAAIQLVGANMADERLCAIAHRVVGDNA